MRREGQTRGNRSWGVGRYLSPLWSAKISLPPSCRFLIIKKEPAIAAFKTPNLRNVLVTGPYFHDGSQQTLWDVIDHYNKGDGLQNPYLDEDIQPLALQESDIDDLVAFLASLTSNDYNTQAVRTWARQRALSQTNRPQRDTTRAFGPKPVKPMPPGP